MQGKGYANSKSTYLLLLLLSVYFSPFLQAADTDLGNFVERDLKNKTTQAEIQKRLESESGSVQLPDFDGLDKPPEESVCFVIENINIDGQFSGWMKEMGQKYLGQCVGQQGIALYLRAINKKLLSLGYITSRAVLPEQDLSKGELSVFIQEGRIERIIFPDKFDRFVWQTAFPMSAGDLLNMRDLEQAVDQLNRLSSVTVKMNIEPSNKEGFSKVIMDVEEKKSWEIGVSLNDAGGETVGLYQLSADVTIDNFIGVLDTLNYSRSLDLNDDKSSDSLSDSFSLNIPIGYWSIDIANSNFNYHQKVNGSVQTFKSSGEGHDSSIKVSHVFYRDNSYKLSWFSGIYKRQRRNYIDDTVVQIQSRDLTNLLLGFGIKKYIGSSVLDINIEAEKGVDLLSAEKVDKTASSSTAQPDYELYGFSGVLSAPFSLYEKSLSLTSQLSFQYSPNPIYTLDWMSNGGRYSVRGYASDEGLSAEHGWLLKNDISIPTRLFGTSFTTYVAMDLGGVSGEGAEDISNKTLMGFALGAKGKVLNADYDAFISQPILLSGPHTDTSCCQVGASLSWQL